MKPPKKTNYSDDFQTPVYVLEPLYKYIERFKTIWEPASGEGNIVRALLDHGHNVAASDILIGEQYNFLTYDYNKDDFDAIITNPPYSLKNEFLERCYEIGKPFALLLPLTALETARRQRLFKTYGIELILFDKRINYITPSKGKSASWFASAWFTWGLNIGKELTFTDLKEEGAK